MTYESVDRLQNLLVKDVFHYAKDAKKAAGRALGTLVEIITFYLLKASGFEHSIAIEKAVPEFGNPEIKHNVEYSLHPILQSVELMLTSPRYPITSARILAQSGHIGSPDFAPSSRTLLSNDGLLRNSCLLGRGPNSQLTATLESAADPAHVRVTVIEQFAKPYAIIECKRVGVEEGMGKGPQTIEKAKQGAYVAKAVSSMHKLRTASGELRGLIYRTGDVPYTKPYIDLLQEVVSSDNPDLLRDFVLTIGVVSNHGNWFTSDDHNKELKVLAQSYDWLVFLTDQGLAEFVTELLLEPRPLLRPARDAFLASYAAEKKGNRFTKVRIDYGADQVLQAYFRDNARRIETWFNIIAPPSLSMSTLQAQLSQLRDKNWRSIYPI
jgi:hypothetical protein